MKSSVFLLAVATVMSVSGSSGQNMRPRPEVGVEEHLGTTIPLDAEFYDEQGHLTPLSAVIDKPTVLMFVYFRCPGICSPLLTEVSRIVDGLDLELGKDYQVVTISFDHREKFDLAAAKKESYLASMRHKVNPAGWRWFAGDSATIQRVTDSAGFYFKRDGNDYIHAGVLIVLSPTGKITRYMNGVQFLPFDIKMAVVEASEGRTAPTIAKILSFCYRYDPEGRTYALNITRISAIIIIVLVACFVGFFVIRPRKQREGR
jgi:protein SCO1